MDRHVGWRIVVGCGLAATALSAGSKAEAHFLGHVGHGTCCQAYVASCEPSCSDSQYVDASMRQPYRGPGKLTRHAEGTAYHARGRNDCERPIQRMHQRNVRNRNGGIR